MLRYILLGTIAYTGMAFVAPNPAYAQETEQTDQSEDDWRNSRRKRKTDDDFDPITNPGGLGSGINLPPLEPIDTLPEESRRHIQRQRAKVIAEMEFGDDVSDIPYEPSEEAKQDPNLAAEEEEAWEVILTDLQGSGGGDQQGEGGPNKVAVAGRGGGGTSSVTRGGSAQSASDILNQLKGLQAGNGRSAGSGSGSADTPQSTQAGGGSQQAGTQGGGQAPSTSDQSQGQGQQQGDQTGQQGQDGQADGQTDGQDGTGQSQATGQDQGQDGADSGASGDGADNGQDGADANSRSPHTPTVDPLNLPERPSTLGNGDGATSSASDYLKGVIGGQATETPETGN